MARTQVKTLSKEAIIEINKKFSDVVMRNEGEIDHIVYKVAGVR